MILYLNRRLTTMSMQSKENCGVCGRPLVYGTEEVMRRCSFCGNEYSTLIYCPEGHYVCDSCHSRDALDALRNVLSRTTSTDPIEILETVMSHPSVPTHGPEHHAMVPAIIVAAVQNAGYPVPGDAVQKALERGAKVPGGWCGFYGVCGAAIGVGTAVSILTGATPLTGKTRALANEATAFALQKMIDGGPRCCKRASRRALETAVEFLKTRMAIDLKINREIECLYVNRNKECIREACAYYTNNAN
jgi:hypothetical protein